MNAVAKQEAVRDDFERFIRISEVKALTGLSTSYIYALSGSGQFPSSIALVKGGTAKAWLLSEVLSWQEQRIAERAEGTGNA